MAPFDVNLCGEMVSPLADLPRKRDRDIPLLFVTGHDASALPTRFYKLARCEKPDAPRKLSTR